MPIATRALAAAAGLALAIAAPAVVAQATWKPTKPITIIVPWAAGGSTDQVTRVTAAEIEKALGQKVVIVNQPALPAPSAPRTRWKREGRLHLDRRRSAGSRHVQGAGHARHRHRRLGLFLNVANVSTLAVNPSTPYKTAAEFIDALKAKPGQISVATAGVNSSGHTAMEAIAKATGTKYKHVTYDGGNPAVVATVAGETDATRSSPSRKRR
jgi:tripartite-type tricarboxylate transporter receptor subunit TctC